MSGLKMEAKSAIRGELSHNKINTMNNTSITRRFMSLIHHLHKTHKLQNHTIINGHKCSVDEATRGISQIGRNLISNGFFTRNN